MATRRYYSANAIDNTVFTGINNSATSVVLASSPTGYPGSFPYVVALDYNTSSEELVLVTSASGATLNITRGYNGTSAQAHNAGAVVRHVIVAQDMTDFQDHAAGTTSVHGITDTSALATKAGSETLTNKTISNGTLTGTLTAGGGVGTSGQVLQSTGTGVQWGSVSATPRIGQVVQATTTSSTNTTSGTYVDATGMSATITPTLSTSKVLVTMNFDANTNGNPSNYNVTQMQIVRGSTAIYSDAIVSAYTTQLTAGALFNQRVTMTFLDSPATTSATTYKLQVLKGSGSVSAGINNFSAACSVILQEVLV